MPIIHFIGRRIPAVQRAAKPVIIILSVVQTDQIDLLTNASQNTSDLVPHLDRPSVEGTIDTIFVDRLLGE